jgi:hypothetical protein
VRDLKAYQALPEKEYYIDIGTKETRAVMLRFEAGEAIFAVLDDDQEVMEVAIDLQTSIREEYPENKP